MIRFGTVGTNWIVDSFIKAGTQDKRFSITAAYSRTKETGTIFTQKHSIPHLFTNIEEMAKSGTIDAVYIASPSAYHYKQAKVFLKHGVAVLCEKPITANLAEVQDLVNVAQENNILLMHAIKTLFEPRLRKVAQLVPQIGKIRQVTSSRCQYSSRYDAFKAGETPNAFNPALANGAAMDIGIYLIQPSVALLGKPKTIQASAIMLRGGIDGAGSLLLGYDDSQAILNFSKIANSYVETEILGEEGSLRWPNHNSSSPRQVILQQRGKPEKVYPVEQDLPDMAYEVKEFLDLYESGQKESSLSPHSDVLTTLFILDEYRKQVGLVFE